MAGQIQSPLGSLATTSTLPYLMLFLPFVDRRAERMGGIMDPFMGSELAMHEELSLPVQVPSLIRSRV